MGTNVHLTPALTLFTKEMVASGRYNNVSEVVREALRLLQKDRERHLAFIASCLEAEAEADREGTVSAEDALAAAEAAIQEVEARLGPDKD